MSTFLVRISYLNTEISTNVPHTYLCIPIKRKNNYIQLKLNTESNKKVAIYLSKSWTT